MGGKKVNLTGEQEKEIINLYKDNLSSKKISKIFKIGEKRIFGILDRNNIYHGGKKITAEQESNIIDMYVNKRMNAYKIAEIENISDVSVYNTLKENNIQRRDNSECKLGVKLKPDTEEQRIARSIRTKKYYDEHPELKELRSKIFKKSWEDSEKNGTKKERVEKQRIWLLENYKSGTIETWNKNKTHLDGPRIVHGEDIHTFNNWSTTEPYGHEFVSALKKVIKKRDNCCLMCNISLEELKLLKIITNIHHVDYDKQNNLIQNLATLCVKCHPKTNGNRPHWTKFFQSLLAERYGYKYSETGQIILNIPDKIIQFVDKQ